MKKPVSRDRLAIDGYVADRSTYARLGERWNVDRSTAWRRVQRALAHRSDLIERTRRCLALCDGVCILDGKVIRIRGKLFTCFVAWDRGLGLPIHFLLREGGEKELWYWKLLLELKEVGYVPKAFVSYGILTLKEFLSEMHPDLPHQRCAVHAFLAARSKVMQTMGRTTERTKEFVESLRYVLWSSTLRKARSRWLDLWKISDLRANERRALLLVKSALAQCFVCRDPRWKYLELPRSSNAIENVMGHIEVRLKTRRGAKDPLASERLVNELLLRVKRQTITHS